MLVAVFYFVIWKIKFQLLEAGIIDGKNEYFTYFLDRKYLSLNKYKCLNFNDYFNLLREKKYYNQKECFRKFSASWWLKKKCV